MARKETPKIQEVVLEIGNRYKTNHYGDVEIIDFKNSKKIVIRFADTDNVQTVQKDALEKGLIQDVLQRKLIADALKREEANRKQRELEAYKRQKELELVAKLREREEYKAKKEAAAVVLEKARTQKAVKEKLKFLQKSFTHPVYGEYVVIDALVDDPFKSVLRIKFIKTGYETDANISSVKSSKVSDKSDGGLFALQVHTSIAGSERYQQDRESRLAQAKNWQKNNPEKAQARNKRRRARKCALEGSATYEEVQQLLISQDCKCSVCKDPLDDTKHLDHIIPITLKGGTGYISNLQWLCQYCSISKNAKTPELWAAVLANDKWWEVKASRANKTSLEPS
jgi:5-methylcytosine-specific restriction endonuclease McrA